MSATDRAVSLAQAAAKAASDKLGEHILAFDVSEQLALTDVFVIVSGNNDPQIRAIHDAVEEALLPMGAKPIRREGEREGRWILLDFGDIVVHIMHKEDRAYYALERLWSDCPKLEVDQ